MNNKWCEIIPSNWNKIFKKDIIRLLKNKKVVSDKFWYLENIHNEILDNSLLDYEFNSGVNGITKKLYETDEIFIKNYHKFIKDLYKKLKFNFYFQSIPTIRVHCPNAKNENHYPRYHNDCFYGHPPQETNIWLSLTNNNHSGFNVIDFKNSCDWIEQNDNDFDKFIEKSINDKEFTTKGNMMSIEVKADTNSIFCFNSMCIHTNQPRKIDSRVSIDVRINPVKNFVDGYVGKGRMKAEFRPGGKFGYHKKSVKELRI